MNHNKLQGRQRGWVKLILFPFTSMTKGQPISFHASQSGGGECVKRTLSSAFVVDVDCGSHYHTGEKQKFQAKLRSRKAYWVRRHNWSRINFGVEFCLATLYRGLNKTVFDVLSFAKLTWKKAMAYLCWKKPKTALSLRSWKNSKYLRQLTFKTVKGSRCS